MDLATRRALVVVMAFGLAWAHAMGLTQFANPTFIDWMIEGDWLGHFFGWLFTRNGPWALPLAQAPDLVAPAGSSAALTDAIPLLSVLGKAVSPLFGDRVQFFGLWMVTGVIGTGVAGVLVCRAWLKDTASLALAGCLFVMNPIVSTRAGHPPFFAFWMLTGLVGACVWPIRADVGELRAARRTAGVTLLLGGLACATNAYLAVMASVLVGASIARLALVQRRFRVGEATAWLVAGPVICAGALWVFGFVTGARSNPMSSLAIEGFGQFSADLLTFINPSVFSRLVPSIATAPRQYEGYAYLGLGTLALLVVRAGLLMRWRPSRAAVIGAVPLLLAVVLMAGYSLSNVVTLAGKTIAHLGFYDALAPWPSVFRSSGRFAWPAFAALTLGAVVWTARLRTAWVRQFVLGGAVLLQLVDFDTARIGLRGKQFPPFEPYRDPSWSLLGEYRHLVIHPVQIQWTCPFDHNLVAKLSWEAARQHLSINSGHVGRAPPGTDCNRHLSPAELRDDTVYFPYFQPFLADFTSAGFVCESLEGVAVCVSGRRETGLLRELQRRAAERRAP